MTVDEIIKQIRSNYGIERIKTNLSSLGSARDGFERIAAAMLEIKGVSFDARKSRLQVEILIKWTYLIDDSLDFQKGILFKGHTGTGKTFLMRCYVQFLKVDNIMFKSNGKPLRLSPVMANCRTVCGEYAESSFGGNDVIRKYSEYPSLILDDIGAEAGGSSSYGNRIDVIPTIIDRRNEANLLTFGTTNLNKVADVYDDRTARRMRELFNVVICE